jgi:hypothetical protein
VFPGRLRSRNRLGGHENGENGLAFVSLTRGVPEFIERPLGEISMAQSHHAAVREHHEEVPTVASPLPLESLPHCQSNPE